MNPAALRIACVAVLVVLGIWAGAWVHSTRGTARGHPGIPVPAGEASGPSASDLTPDPDGAQPVEGVLPTRKIPDRLPVFSLGDRQGKATSIAAFAGNSLIINFWATWCAPCRREIPLLENLSSEWAGRGVTLVGIAVDHRDKVLAFADRFKIGYPLLIGEQEALDAAAAFGVDTPVFPFTVFTDRREDVVAVFLGELHPPQAELILGVVLSLDEGRMQLPEARQAIALGLRALPYPGPQDALPTDDGRSPATRTGPTTMGKGPPAT
jgi:thiol-disulfide isomerase/thioredoxin